MCSIPWGTVVMILFIGGFEPLMSTVFDHETVVCYTCEIRWNARRLLWSLLESMTLEPRPNPYLKQPWKSPSVILIEFEGRNVTCSCLIFNITRHDSWLTLICELYATSKKMWPNTPHHHKMLLNTDMELLQLLSESTTQRVMTDIYVELCFCDCFKWIWHCVEMRNVGSDPQRRRHQCTFPGPLSERDRLCRWFRSSRTTEGSSIAHSCGQYGVDSMGATSLVILDQHQDQVALVSVMERSSVTKQSANSGSFRSHSNCLVRAGRCRQNLESW